MGSIQVIMGPDDARAMGGSRAKQTRIVVA